MIRQYSLLRFILFRITNIHYCVHAYCYCKILLQVYYKGGGIIGGGIYTQSTG